MWYTGRVEPIFRASWHLRPIVTNMSLPGQQHASDSSGSSCQECERLRLRIKELTLCMFSLSDEMSKLRSELYDMRPQHQVRPQSNFRPRLLLNLNEIKPIQPSQGSDSMQLSTAEDSTPDVLDNSKHDRAMDQGLKEFIKESVELDVTTTQNQQLVDIYQKLTSQIRSLDTIKHVLPAGSFPKGTKICLADEFDLLVCFEISSVEAVRPSLGRWMLLQNGKVLNPSDYLNRLLEMLSSKFNRTSHDGLTCRFRRSDPSITAEVEQNGEKVSFDLLPTISDSAGQYFIPGVPTERQLWLSTITDQELTEMSSATQKNAGVLDVIRLLKYFKLKLLWQGISSYTLERIVLESSKAGWAHFLSQNLNVCLHRLFKKVRDEHGVADPAQPGNNLLLGVNRLVRDDLVNSVKSLLVVFEGWRTNTSPDLVLADIRRVMSAGKLPRVLVATYSPVRGLPVECSPSLFYSFCGIIPEWKSTAVGRNLLDYVWHQCYGTSEYEHTEQENIGLIRKLAEEAPSPDFFRHARIPYIEVTEKNNGIFAALQAAITGESNVNRLDGIGQLNTIPESMMFSSVRRVAYNKAVFIFTNNLDLDRVDSRSLADLQSFPIDFTMVSVEPGTRLIFPPAAPFIAAAFPFTISAFALIGSGLDSVAKVFVRGDEVPEFSLLRSPNCLVLFLNGVSELARSDVSVTSANVCSFDVISISSPGCVLFGYNLFYARTMTSTEPGESRAAVCLSDHIACIRGAVEQPGQIVLSTPFPSGYPSLTGFRVGGINSFE